MSQLAILELQQHLGIASFKIKGAQHEEDLEDELKWEGIFKLPEHIYQRMFLNAQQMTLKASADVNKKILQDYIVERHPGFLLEWFIDVTTKEANQIHKYLTWGLWYKVVVDKSQRIEFQQKQLGNEQDLYLR